MAPRSYLLYEHAAGYALFQVSEFEELAANQPDVEQSVVDRSRFSSMVKLVAFQPFRDQLNALESCNALTESQLPDDLRSFLDANLPEKKRKKLVVGMSDPKLSAALQEQLGLTTQSFGVVPEILRGVRLHFDHLVQGFSTQASSKAQLGLAHGFSRAKVKFNVHKQDIMIVQSISILDQLDKDINTFCMRIKEWYSYHYPELAKIVPENHLYAQIVHVLGSRADIGEEKAEKMREILHDDGKVQEILEAAKMSMGMDISDIDLLNLQMFCTRVVRLVEYRKMQQEYLKSKMTTIAPNLSALIGEQVGARLICHAGSLTSLAKYPASTVQILGAEKALFRALKTKGRTPKYGLIFHSSFIGQAKMKDKGRISRFLANKCSIASRVDCFSDVPTDVFGNRMREQIEARLKFLAAAETGGGEKPPKNAEIMQLAIDEALVVRAEIERKRAKEARKAERRRRKTQEAEEAKAEAEEEPGAVVDTTDAVEKKKRKHTDANGGDEQVAEPVAAEDVSSPKKKKKRKSKAAE